MIAKLKGLIDEVGADWAVIDVGGVGYLVFCSARTLKALPTPGQAASLTIETHVREDHIHLYGFATRREQDFFRLLQSVQGVGARVALAILSALPPDPLANAIAAGDVKAITRAHGVGAKLAARIVSELKDKVGGLAARAAPAALAKPGTAPSPPSAVEDAVSALVNLGYGRTEAYAAIADVHGRLGEGAELAALIRAGLKELAA
ncbi:MAG: Holliday junction branch migration protein RuvA [Pseudomonadota bacterium]